jgi:hypothetical protein
MLDHICTFMASLTEAVLLDRTLEILHTEGEPAPLQAANVSDAWESDDDS